ncbi:uncharacterized protein MONBRDRAFT_27345 [Monosiga brevicollis MX1]|uniref:Uncharacterized protein n=1 Tax=Monosiga brevicollis TaxID=81824 RepID=A9V507_MONBE|nr:uncharacterized protein MONBRDRAFT_27345 [Monosiga brevicollis MX1]EDQ87463.1 predicted protein [Monosiga brevicollis MX1]|eukprot:XP_001747723.1 hypothetical protein [Monosiga brevicollis MX1]
MSDDGEQLFSACDSSDPQEALQLVTSWDQQRVRDAAQYKGGWFGNTPLHEACFMGHVKVVEMLLKHGADAEAKTSVHLYHMMMMMMLMLMMLYLPDGDTSLHRACYKGHVKVAEMLLKHGADTAAKNNGGHTPLHYCVYGHDKVAEMLLKHGADTEAKNNDGQTPLQLACAAIHPSRKVVQQLLRHGANPDARDLRGARPLDLLLGRGRIKLEVITELLGATQTLCSYQTSNSDDLQILVDCVAALTSAAQAAPTN